MDNYIKTYTRIEKNYYKIQVLVKWITLTWRTKYSDVWTIGVCNRQLRICNKSRAEWSLSRNREASLLFVVKMNPLRDGRANRDLRQLPAKSALSCDTNNVRVLRHTSAENRLRGNSRPRSEGTRIDVPGGGAALSLTGVPKHNVESRGNIVANALIFRFSS